MHLNKHLSKTIVVSSMILSMFFQSFDAVARVGGSRSSSFGSSSHSTSSYSSSPQRVGGGTSAGMQRSDVMNKARQDAPIQSATAVAPTQAAGALPANAAAQPAKPGFGVGSLVGAAAAGAAVGYIANSAMHNNNQPMQAGSSATGQYEDPTSVNHQVANPGFPWGTILMFFLGVAAIVAILTHLSRKRELAGKTAAYAPINLVKTAPNYAANALPAQVSNAEQQDLERNALKFFYDLQDANNRGDIAFMQENSIAPLQAVLVSDIQNRATASRTQVMNMSADLIDMTNEDARSIASVQFKGMVREGDNAASDQVNEVWHFVRGLNDDSNWQLAGIEQV